MRRRQRGASGPSRRAALIAAGAVVAGGGIVALLRWRLWSAGVPAPPAAPLRDHFDPAELGRARDYRRGLWAMAAAGAVIGPAVVVGAALAGRRWRPLVVRAARARPWRAGAIAGGGLAAALVVVPLPLAAARFAWGRHYGIVTQGTGGWLLDQAKGLGVQAVVLGLAGSAGAAMIARLPRAWWAGAAVGLAALIYGAGLLSPLVLEPLFQRTEPLRDPALRAEVLDLADRAGVEAGDVEVNDASSRTTAANAYVSGLGHSRHVVLFDTLLRDFPRDQVRTVVAHELSHVSRQHVLKGSTWGAALAVPGCLLAFALVGWRTGFGRAGPGAAGCDLVLRRLAIATAGAFVLAAASAPLANWVSRAYEREADWRALALTGDPGADIRLQQGLVERSLNVPDPPAAVRLWFGTHPTALQRIGLALEAERRAG